MGILCCGLWGIGETWVETRTWGYFPTVPEACQSPGESSLQSSNIPHMNTWCHFLSALAQLPGTAAACVSGRNSFGLKCDSSLRGTMRFNSALACQDVFWGSCCISCQVTCHQGLPRYSLVPDKGRAWTSALTRAESWNVLKNCHKKTHHKHFEHIRKELLQRSGTENLPPPLQSAGKHLKIGFDPSSS